jgi:hypothetical protein
MRFKIFGLTLNFDLHLLVLHLIYFILLLWVYTTYIVVIFEYEGFYKDALNINKAILAPFIIIAAFTLLRNNGLPSYFFLNLIIALTLTPSLVIFSGSDLPFSFIALTWAAFAVLALVATFVKVPLIPIKYINSKRIMQLFAVISLLFIASIFAFGGGQYMNFNFELVEQFRGPAAENLPVLYGYLMSNFANVIIPTGVVLCILYRQRLLLFINIFCAVMIFALSSQKSPLFVPIIVFFVYWFSHHKRGLTITLLALITIVMIGGLDFYLYQQGGEQIVSGWFGSLFVRRTLIVPSFLNWSYYDYFSVHPYSYWADSKFSLGLIEKTYDRSISLVIGEDYLGKIALNSNTGWIGSGMGQAGYFGVALYSVSIGLILSFLDSYSKKLGYSLVLSIFIISVIIMTISSDLTTMILTNGLFVLLLILITLSPNYKHATFYRYYT